MKTYEVKPAGSVFKVEEIDPETGVVRMLKTFMRRPRAEEYREIMESLGR